MEKTKVHNFIVRLDTETNNCLIQLAKVTHRTKAQATRAAIQIAYSLFVSGNSMELEKQSDKEVSISI